MVKFGGRHLTKPHIWRVVHHVHHSSPCSMTVCPNKGINCYLLTINILVWANGHWTTFICNLLTKGIHCFLLTIYTLFESNSHWTLFICNLLTFSRQYFWCYQNRNIEFLSCFLIAYFLFSFKVIKCYWI